MKNLTIFDIEGDGMVPTKIWCVGYCKFIEGGWKVGTITDYDEMREFFSDPNQILVGHNIIWFDIPVVERILDIEVKSRLFDTLPISWQVLPERLTQGKRYGLEAFGEDFGVPKVEILDWESLPLEDYLDRVREDCKINTNLMSLIWKKCMFLYDGDIEEIYRLFDYLTFKMVPYRLAEESKWKVDKDFTVKTLDWFLYEKSKITMALQEVMPQIKKYGEKRKPKVMYRKDGSLSINGEKWIKACKLAKVGEDYEGTIKYVTKLVPPNPTSHQQVKDWLFSLGWKPSTFDYKREGKEVRKIPQLKKDGHLCPSVIALYEKGYEEVGLLENLSILTHRIGLLEGFLSEMDENGFVTAQTHGLTNTLRYKHKKPLVNLPGVNKKRDFTDGHWIRGCLIAPEGYELCGSDMSGLESRTRDHYIFPYDPNYVEEMSADDYDPHLAMGLTASILSQGDVDFYKEKKELIEKAQKKNEDNPLAEEEQSRFADIHIKRHKSKTTNYSAIYGVGKFKLSKELDISEEEALGLIEGFWKKNWSIKKVASIQKIKKIGEQMWLFNPVSRFWYSLRFEKDIFSTLNQSTGVYCFDLWIQEFLKMRPQITGQFHDEVILTVKKGYRDMCDKMLRLALKRAEKRIGLSRKLDIDVLFGDSYAEIH